MENHRIDVKQNINIEVNAPCPKCEEGHLLPFLEPKYTETGMYGNPYDAKLDHYEIIYRCSNCNYRIDKDSLVSDDGEIF